MKRDINENKKEEGAIYNIYIGKGKCFSMPGQEVRKIGRTTKNVENREKDLSKDTGNVSALCPIITEPIYENVHKSLETDIHQELTRLGLCVEKEFFDFARETGYVGFDTIADIDEKVKTITKPIYDRYNKFMAFKDASDDDKINQIIKYYQTNDYDTGEKCLASQYNISEITTRKLIIEIIDICMEYMLLPIAKINVISSIEYLLILIFKYKCDPINLTFFSDNIFFRQISDALGVANDNVNAFKNSKDTCDLITGTPKETKTNWDKIMNKGIPRLNDDGIIGIVAPNSWGSLGGSNKNKSCAMLENWFKPNQVISIDTTAQQYFDKLKAKAGIGAFIIKNKPYSKDIKTRYKTNDGIMMVDMHEYMCHTPKYPQKEFTTLINRWYDNEKYIRYTWITEDPYPNKRMAMGKDIIDDTGKLTKPASNGSKVDIGHYTMEKTDTHTYRAYHSNNSKRTSPRDPTKPMWRYTTREFTLQCHNEAKILISNSGKSEELFHLFENDCSITDASMCMVVEDYTDAQRESMLSVFNSNFIRFLILAVYKWDDFFNMNFIQMIPDISGNEILSENEIMDKLMTVQERHIIEPLYKEWLAGQKENK